MLRKIIFISLLMAGVTANGEVDEDFMKNMEDLNKSMANNLGIGDGKSATTEAQELDKMFVEVEAHFVKKGDAADGVKWSQDSRELTAAILAAVSANDFDTAQVKATALSKTCKACHKVYKKKEDK